MNHSENNYSRIIKSRNEGDTGEERDFAAERLIRFLNRRMSAFPEGISFQEVLRSRDSIKEFILSLNYPDYAKLLIGINAMVRNKTGHETWKMDGDGVLMGDQNIFPDQTDKEIVLAQSLLAAKAMAENGRSIEDISIQLTTSLTAIHPFADGNGRTAKFLLTMLNAGFDPKLLKEVLISEGFSNAVNAVLFQDAAVNVLDPAHELTWEKYDAWLKVPENRRKIAELIIDMIQNDQSPQYLREDNISQLDIFKMHVKEATDTNIYERVFCHK